MAFTVSVSATESDVNVANNTSKLTVSLTLNSTYGSWFGDNKTGTITIDGTNYSITYNFPSGTTSKNIGSASKTITHNNSTGAYTASWSYSIPTNSSQGTKTGSGSTTLTTIARASEPTVSSSSVNLGTAVTINTNYKNTSFRHTITYSIGSDSGTIGTAKGVAASVSWTPPATLAQQFPNATSGVVTITCQTYNGDSLVGTKTCTLTVKTIDNDTYQPTIALSATETGTFNNGKLLNRISGITIAATNTFKYNATLSSYSISGASKSSTNSSLSLSPINVTMSSATTTLSFTGTVTDSRGYSRTSSALTKTVYRYNKPQIISYSVYRCASSSSSTPSSGGTYVAVVITYTYQNDGYSNTMNVKSININNTSYNLTTTETTSNGVVTGTGTTIVGDGNISATTSYPYTITCTDLVGQSVTVSGNVPTADRIWSVRPQGKGMAIGKYAEHDSMLESAWEVKAPKFTGTNSTAPQFEGTATNAQNAQTDTTDPDSQTSYYPTFTTGSGNQRQRINGGALYYFKKGTASAVGETYLRLGNATGSGTANNKKGFIQLYGQNTGRAQIEYANSTSNVTTTIPALSGTAVVKQSATIATETNGWYKVNMGAFTMYFKNGTINSKTYSGNGWGWLSSSDGIGYLPSGVTYNSAKMIFVGNGGTNDTAIILNFRLNNGSGAPSVHYQNKYSSNVTTNGWYNYLLIVFP